MSLTTRIITWDFTDCGKDAQRGSVSIAPSEVLTDPADAVIVTTAPKTWQYSGGTGSSVIGLIDTDNIAIQQQGSWFYVVSVQWGNQPAWTVPVLLPSGVGSIDLSSLPEPVPSAGMQGYLSASGGTLTGPLVLDGNPPVKIPSGAANGDVLTSDASGNASWQPASGGGAVTSVFTRTGAVVATSGDYAVGQVTGAAPLASPALTGTPTAPTQTTGDNTTKIATDAFVATAVATETARAETAEALLAPLASPALTGTPTAPTKTALTSNTDIATTAYADSAVAVEASRAETAEALALPKAGGTMSGPIAMGGSKVTGAGNASASGDLVPYGQLGSAAFQGSSAFDAAGAATTAQATAEAASTPILTRVAVQTANYTASANQIVPCGTTSGSFTVTLPNAPAAGALLAVKDVTLGAGNTVTVACAGSDVFNLAGGVTTGTLKLLSQGMLLHYNGAGIWTVLADDLPLTQLDGRYLPLPSGGTYPGGAATFLRADQTWAAPSGQHVTVVTTGNAVQLTGCTLTSGSAAATFNGGSLTSGDAGKAVVAVSGANSLITTIASVTDSTHATLTATWPGANTIGAVITYGTDMAGQINTAATTLGNLGGGTISVASPVLCLSAISLPSSVAITGLGFDLGAVIYAGHYGNIIQSSLWGQAGTAQNQFCDAFDLTLIALLPTLNLALGATDSAGASQYLFTTVQLTPGTLSQTFTSGAFPVSASLDARWPAGSAGSPVYFWHNNVLFYYNTSTPFAACAISDPAVSSATILTHGYVYPLNSQGHGVAFQSFRGKISRVRTFNTLGSAVRVQGSGTADPTAYGHKIEWIRGESSGWAIVDLGEATTDDFVDIVSGTLPGVAGVIVMGGDPTIRTVHAVGDPTRPWVPHVVACPTNGSYRDIILDTAYGPGFVFDGGLQWRGVGPSQSRLDGLRYLGSAGKPGHGVPIQIKTRANTINADHLGISGVTFDQSCAFLVAHGPQTQMANGANVSLSTTAATLPVLDATSFDPMGGQVSVTHGTSTRTVTYTGAVINTTLTSGSQQTFTIGSGGTVNLSQALPVLPVTGDWYIVGGVIAVQVSSSNAGGAHLVFGNSVSLYGASGAVNIAGGSFVSRQALAGATLASGTLTTAAGDVVVQAQLQQGTVQGSLSVPGATGMTLPAAQPAVSVKSTDSLLLTPDSQLGTGLGVTAAVPQAGSGFYFQRVFAV